MLERMIDLMEERNELLRDIKKLLEGKGTNDEHMLEAAEAAKYIHVSYDTILRWAKEGKIPSSRPGHRVLFRKSALDKWLADHEQGGSGTKPKSEKEDGYGVLRKIIA